MYLLCPHTADDSLFNFRNVNNTVLEETQHLARCDGAKKTTEGQTGRT